MDSIDQSIRPLLEAVAFAGRAHHGQMRKDGKTPYASHVFRVCLVVRQVFGVDDPAVLTTALLHDTIEDTTTDFDDVARCHGAEIAGWVGCLSKDKRLPDEEREDRYCAGLAAAPWQVKICKLADVFDNLLDSGHLPVDQRRRTAARSRCYLEAFDQPDSPDQVRDAMKIVRRAIVEVEATLP